MLTPFREAVVGELQDTFGGANDHPLCVRHQRACDASPVVQKWLLEAGDADMVFKDLKDCACTCGFDLRRKQHVVVPSSDFDATGWMCTAVSMANPARRQNMSCISDKTDSSGVTFAHWVDVLQAHQPLGGFGENVILGIFSSARLNARRTDFLGRVHMLTVLPARCSGLKGKHFPCATPHARDLHKFAISQ